MIRNVILDHTGNYDLTASVTRRHTDTYPDSQLVLKNSQCTNGFCVQIKGENVTIKARGF